MSPKATTEFAVGHAAATYEAGRDGPLFDENTENYNFLKFSLIRKTLSFFSVAITHGPSHGVFKIGGH